VGRIVSGVRGSASFQIIPRLVDRLGSEIRVSVSFSVFSFKNVCPVMLLPSRLPSPAPERSLFFRPACPVMFLGDATMAPLHVFYGPHQQC